MDNLDNGKCEVVDGRGSPTETKEVPRSPTIEQSPLDESNSSETNLSKSNLDYSEASRISKLDAFQVDNSFLSSFNL